MFFESCPPISDLCSDKLEEGPARIQGRSFFRRTDGSRLACPDLVCFSLRISSKPPTRSTSRVYPLNVTYSQILYPICLPLPHLDQCYISTAHARQHDCRSMSSASNSNQHDAQHRLSQYGHSNAQSKHTFPTHALSFTSHWIMSACCTKSWQMPHSNETMLALSAVTGTQHGCVTCDIAGTQLARGHVCTVAAWVPRARYW